MLSLFLFAHSIFRNETSLTIGQNLRDGKAGLAQDGQLIVSQVHAQQRLLAAKKGIKMKECLPWRREKELMFNKVSYLVGKCVVADVCNPVLPQENGAKGGQQRQHAQSSDPRCVE